MSETFGERLRAFAGDLVGDAFVADIHSLDGNGPREVQKLANLFEAKILDFMIANSPAGKDQERK